MKSVVVTGAAGFTGYSVTKEFSDQGYKVYAVVRPGSSHNKRLTDLINVKTIELDICDFEELPRYIDEVPDYMVHLVWIGERYSSREQNQNIYDSLRVLEVAKKIGCSRYLCTGSQAELGATVLEQTEDMMPNPFCAYGASKVAACYLTRYHAKELGVEWIWGRIFSLYGTFEPSGRMLPDLIERLKHDEPIAMSSCVQNWDYLHVKDAAKAIVALVEYGKCDEIYNIANGKCRVLKDFVEEVKRVTKSNSQIVYGNNPEPFVSLQPSSDKIKHDTGWQPSISFEQGIREMMG